MHSNIQQLEAEVERLRGLLDRSRIGDYVGQNRVGEDWARLTRERDEWKTEVKEYKALALAPDGTLWRQRCKQVEAEVERLRAALGECYSDLCGLEPLLTDTEQARLLSSAISWCKYLKQPEWNERVDRLRAALEELVTYQNGSPLPSYDEGWANAMRLADEALRGEGEK